MEYDKKIQKSKSSNGVHQNKKKIRKQFNLMQNLFKLSLVAVLVLVVVSRTIGEISCADVTVIVIAWDQIQIIQESVNSIISINSGLICKLIVVYSGANIISSQKLTTLTDKITAQIKNFQFIIDSKKQGVLAMLDESLKMTTSPYFFVSIGPWKYSQNYFLKQAQQILDNNESISQVVIGSLDQVETREVEFVDSMLAGFNLLPSLHRLQAYKFIQNGYSGLTANISLGKSVGFAEPLISKLYLENNYRIVQLGLKRNKIQKKYTNSAPSLKFKIDYLYRRYWKTDAEENNICSFTLLYEKFRAHHHSHRRDRKKKLIQSFKSLKPKQVTGYEILGIDQHIQIGSEFDYLNIINTPQYQNFEKQFSSTLHFEAVRHEINYEGNTKYFMDIHEFSNIYQASKYIFDQNANLVPEQSNQLQLKLAASLISNPYDTKYINAEYLIRNQMHELYKVNTNLKLCIFMQGFNVYSRSSLAQTLASISRQNYSNFEVVFVSDENEDSSRDLFYDIVASTQPKIYNRLKAAVYNQDILGTSGNVYLRARQFCKNTDVVVVVNGNSTFIGNQAFNVINKAYQNQNTWVTIFPTVMQNDAMSYYTSKSINFQQDLRKQGFDISNYLITFRYDLILSLPLSHVIQFKRNRETGTVFPAFYEAQSNSFYVYSLIELSGKERTQFYKAAIFYYNELGRLKNKRCKKEQGDWIRLKSALKYPLIQIKSFKQKATLDISKAVKIQTLSKFRHFFQKYKNCLADFADSNKIQQYPFENPMNMFLNLALTKMRFPNFYIMDDQNMGEIDDLPFCLVVNTKTKNEIEKQQLLKSIQQQNYRNYTLLMYEGNSSFSLNAISKQVNNKLRKQIYKFTAPSLNYFSYKKLFEQVCVENSVIMIVNSPLQKQVLNRLNNIHQRSNSWMTYSVEGNLVQIHSFYIRVYDLVQKNDFYGTNAMYLNEQRYELPVLAMLELCPHSSYKLNYNSVYIQLPSVDQNINAFNLMRTYTDNKVIYTRHLYQYLQTLSQDFPQNMQALQIQLQKLHENKQYLMRPNINSYLSKFDMLRAFQYEQITYLPDNHMLNKRQYSYLDKQHQINKYVSGEYANKTTRFCCTIFGRNNTENSRYINNLKSVIMQNYSNFHIVLLDDASDDQTLKLSMQFLRKSNFPKQRVTYVQNLNRTFATYNIINSAFNFCGADDVQVRIDGDDILLGKNVFSLLNAAYLKNPQLWITYTSYKSSIFTYGLSSQIQRKEQMVNCQGGRRRFHFIGPLTTWRVKLIRSIPIKYHKLPSGQWLNTLYDDALQFPLFQLATIERIHYIPYISYNYNTQYGSNDDSDKQKIKDRIALFEYVVTLDSLEPLPSLNDPRTNNQQIRKILQLDRDKIYKQVFM